MIYNLAYCTHTQHTHTSPLSIHLQTIDHSPVKQITPNHHRHLDHCSDQITASCNVNTHTHADIHLLSDGSESRASVIFVMVWRADMFDSSECK